MIIRGGTHVLSQTRRTQRGACCGRTHRQDRLQQAACWLLPMVCVGGLWMVSSVRSILIRVTKLTRFIVVIIFWSGAVFILRPGSWIMKKMSANVFDLSMRWTSFAVPPPLTLWAFVDIYQNSLFFGTKAPPPPPDSSHSERCMLRSDPSSRSSPASSMLAKFAFDSSEGL